MTDSPAPTAQTNNTQTDSTQTNSTQTNSTDATGKTLLQLTGIKKSYDQTEVLKDITLDIKHGEFLTLLGPSGCGKTTLLRLIAGFEQPSVGKIQLDGMQMAGLPADKRPVNTVFQQYALFPHMTVAQNVAYGLKFKKAPKAEIQTRVREMLAMVQMEHLANRRPQDLSGGQQQRVAIARAFAAEPEKFAPQYGGYCAWAMADGKHAKGDARYWKIVDGKLYLNYSKSIQKKWDSDVPAFIDRADTAWASIND